MTFEEMSNAVRQAKNTLANADSHVSTMADMIVGRLRHCNDWTLRRLKRELRDYNPHTKTWR